MSKCVSETLLLGIHRSRCCETVSSKWWANDISCAGIPPLGAASASETFYFQSSNLPRHPSDSILLYYWHNIA